MASNFCSSTDCFSTPIQTGCPTGSAFLFPAACPTQLPCLGEAPLHQHHLTYRAYPCQPTVLLKQLCSTPGEPSFMNVCQMQYLQFLTSLSRSLLQSLHPGTFYKSCLTDDTSIDVFQGSLLACQAIADQRQLSYKLHSTAQELNQRYPLNAKEGYQGLFEDGAGSINVCPINVGTFSRTGA